MVSFCKLYESIKNYLQPNTRKPWKCVFFHSAERLVGYYTPTRSHLKVVVLPQCGAFSAYFAGRHGIPDLHDTKLRGWAFSTTFVALHGGFPRKCFFVSFQRGRPSSAQKRLAWQAMFASEVLRLPRFKRITSELSKALVFQHVWFHLWRHFIIMRCKRRCTRLLLCMKKSEAGKGQNKGFVASWFLSFIFCGF